MFYCRYDAVQYAVQILECLDRGMNIEHNSVNLGKICLCVYLKCIQILTMYKMWTSCFVVVLLVALTCAENDGSMGQQYTRSETPKKIITTEITQKIKRAVNQTEQQQSIATNEPRQKIQRNFTAESPQKEQQLPTQQPQNVFTTEQPKRISTTEPGHIPALHPGTKSSKLIYLIVFLVLAHIYFFSNLFICFVYETGPFWRLMVNIRAAFANDYQRMT